MKVLSEGLAGQTVRTLRADGVHGVAARVARLAYRHLNARELDFLLLAGDIADSTVLRMPPAPPRPARSRKLVIGWVSTPPSAGSGGHTTMFRMVEALEAAGHTCVLYLYDRYAGSLARHTQIIRTNWPNVRAAVRDSRELTTRSVLDGCVATSWVTAHVLAKRPVATRRFYFVQDYEPFFYPMGSECALAEDTYRFGFRCIAVGTMVADLLRERCGVDAAIAEFGCDTAVYRLDPARRRSGVVFYAKPEVPRRGYRLGVLALEHFHARHPEQPIHVFGDVTTALPFPVVRHGRMTPAKLNSLYNSTIAGLAMSFTNISLVAEEMLAAGTIPVVNDSPYTRADISSQAVRWARATPSAFADQLCSAVEADDLAEQAAQAAASVRKGWKPAQTEFVRVIEAETYGHGSSYRVPIPPARAAAHGR